MALSQMVLSVVGMSFGLTFLSLIVVFIYGEFEETSLFESVLVKRSTRIAAYRSS